MIEIKQSDWRIGCEMDLMTYGIGSCVGIVVGYYAAVSMFHAPMPMLAVMKIFFKRWGSHTAGRSLLSPSGSGGGHGMLGRPVSAVMRKHGPGLNGNCAPWASVPLLCARVLAGYTPVTN